VAVALTRTSNTQPGMHNLHTPAPQHVASITLHLTFSLVNAA
jgi:hypothetical protein